MKKRKYNKQTGCYKIDLYVNGKYFCSTDQHSTLKSAKESVATKHKIPIENIYAEYDHN